MSQTERPIDLLDEIILYVQREKRRLPEKHHEFIDVMAARPRHYAMTPKQEYLRALFLKLGGKIT